MSDILIRGVDEETLEQLKARAKRNGRSLQSEAKMLLEQAAGSGARSVSAVLKKWRRRLAGRDLTRSGQIIRRDRKR